MGLVRRGAPLRRERRRGGRLDAAPRKFGRYHRRPPGEETAPVQPKPSPTSGSRLCSRATLVLQPLINPDREMLPPCECCALCTGLQRGPGAATCLCSPRGGAGWAPARSQLKGTPRKLLFGASTPSSHTESHTSRASCSLVPRPLCPAGRAALTDVKVLI